jgi:phosphoribosylamine--glycine ligase
MKVLVVGHGAREHAMAKSLVSNGTELHAAMSRREIIDINNPQHYDRFRNVDIAFIGPEAPLATGVSDKLNELGIPVVGPTKEAARLEWSKAYARIFLDDNGIHGNPSYKICRTLADVREYLEEHKDVAVKPDVLTGGKGVKITSEHLQSSSEVEDYALERISEDGVVVLEEKLVGNEFTLQAFTDGKTVEVMPLVRDYKRAYDGDGIIKELMMVIKVRILGAWEVTAVQIIAFLIFLRDR